MLEALGRRPLTIAAASVVVGALLVIAKLVVGVLTGSLGVLSEAVHSMLDLAASLFTLLALRAAAKPADSEHPYGHGRAENLAAFAEGMILCFTALGIGYEAISRLILQQHAVVAAGYAMVLMVAGMGIEGGRAAILRAVGRAAGSAALEADAQNRGADVLASLGVLIGLVGVRFGYQWADAAAALLVAAVILRAAVLLMLHAGDILIDRSPAGVADRLRETIRGVDGVRDVRGVRLRRSGARMMGDVRVAARRTLSVEGAQELSQEVRDAVARDLPEVDLTLVVESDILPFNLVERVHAAAARQGEIRDLHNVLVEREEDGSLHLSMHAKLPGGINLRQAAATSADLERAVRAELPEASRIDVHLEPLEPNWVAGENVTERHRELGERIRGVVERNPEVVRCRDVELSSRAGRIYAHVVAEMRGDTSLEHAHTVETTLEEAVRSAVPELEDVVARATTA
jgi:cation diffusion facilitator family transporter